MHNNITKILIFCVSASFAPDISKMPPEMMNEILSNLELSDLGKLSATNIPLNISSTEEIETRLKVIKSGKLGRCSWKELQTFRKNPTFRPLVDKILTDNLELIKITEASIMGSESITMGSNIVYLKFDPTSEVEMCIAFQYNGNEYFDFERYIQDFKIADLKSLLNIKWDWSVNIKLKGDQVASIRKKDIQESGMPNNENTFKRLYQLALFFKEECDSDKSLNEAKAIIKRLKTSELTLETWEQYKKAQEKMDEYLKTMLSEAAS